MTNHTSEPTLRLRIYIGESSRHHHQPLYHAIVLKAREMGLAGITVMRAVEGFGPSSRIHAANLLSLSGDLPIVIEAVDLEERINALLEALEGMIDHGLITTDAVHVRRYGSSHTMS